MERLTSLFVLSLILVSFMGFAFAADPPMPPGSEEVDQLNDDLEELKNLTDQIPIDPVTGEFDVTKVEGIKLKAQERIDKINEWLDENVSWLRFIFRMPPEVSWLFFANLYVLLFFLTILVLNADELFFFISKEVAAYGAGIALFVILLVTHVYLNLAKLLVKVADLIINTIIPYGVIAVVVGAVILFVLFFTIPGFASIVLRGVASVSKGMGYRNAAAGALKEIRKRSKEELAVMAAHNKGADLG
jgi:hypothetical protein